MEEDKNKPNQLNIELSEEIAEGLYSNLAIIAHSNSEFILDFINIIHGTPKAKVKSRVIVNPENAKRLLVLYDSTVRVFRKKLRDLVKKKVYDRILFLCTPEVMFDLSKGIQPRRGSLIFGGMQVLRSRIISSSG